MAKNRGTMGNRIGYIDFAKGFAILAIVCFHYLQPFAKGFMAHAIMFGGSGVHLFFILSGFGLALSSQNTTLDFYTRRGRKILIPYFISVSLIAAVNVFVPIYDDRVYAFGGHLWRWTQKFGQPEGVDKL
jgi:peptidoglycan/LPS O-acetylase OafA/YrhL